MNKFRVIVAGGRTFSNHKLLLAKLDHVLREKCKTHEIHIVCGMARGADLLGMHYAKYRSYAVDECPANWDAFGKSAGYKRNQEMADNADACVVFWDGKSRGSKHMIDIAKEQGLPTVVVSYD